MTEDSFKLIYFIDMEDVRLRIRECQGKHVQQVAYSTYHDALTQICFDCKVIRTNIILDTKTKARGADSRSNEEWENLHDKKVIA